MNAKFEFYEVVKIKPSKSRTSKEKRLQDCEGAILARGEHNDTWLYQIFVFDTQTTWRFTEEELVATGKIKTRADFYDGSSITVVVDPETGEGDIKEAD